MYEESKNLGGDDGLLDEMNNEKSSKSLIEKFSCCCHFYTKTGFFIFGVLLFILWIYNKFV